MLRCKVNEILAESRSSARSRAIIGLMQEQGFNIGRYKIRRLMQESGLVCKQLGSHA